MSKRQGRQDVQVIVQVKQEPKEKEDFKGVKKVKNKVRKEGKLEKKFTWANIGFSKSDKNRKRGFSVTEHTGREFRCCLVLQPKV